jgi:hypothetical protein
MAQDLLRQVAVLTTLFDSRASADGHTLEKSEKKNVLALQNIERGLLKLRSCDVTRLLV